MKLRQFAVPAMFTALILAGCASKPPQPEAAKPAAPAPAAPAPETAQPAPAPAAPTETYSRLAGRKIKPIEAKPITLKTKCTYRDPTGYGGKLNLAMKDSKVSTLNAVITVPKRGKCSFDLKDFHQTATMPSATLAANRGSCTVRLWEQEGKVTVAFNSCKDRCEGDSFDYVWPILINAKTGKCS